MRRSRATPLVAKLPEKPSEQAVVPRGLRLVTTPETRRQPADARGQLVLFESPTSSPAAERRARTRRRVRPVLAGEASARLESIVVSPGALDVVLSGSFRKDEQGLAHAYEQLLAVGCRVLSPGNVRPARQEDGFVYMDGESAFTPEALETRHLDAIQRAQFVWLHAPEGYVGPSASLEVGFASANGIPVFSSGAIPDVTLRQFVTIVPSPQDAVEYFRHDHVVCVPPALRTFQHYYRRVAVQRGYATEDAQNCLLLMIEEVGELARALRKDLGLVRHHGSEVPAVGLELADVMLYVIHMANTLGLDVPALVHEKETLNAKRFLEHLRKRG